MRQPLRTCRIFCILAITAIFFATGPASRAQNQSQGNASSAAREEALAAPGGVQILTPIEGVDFGLYLNGLIRGVRNKWYASMPEAALKGEKGEAIIRFRVESDGKADDIRQKRVREKMCSIKRPSKRSATRAPSSHSPPLLSTHSSRFVSIFTTTWGRQTRRQPIVVRCRTLLHQKRRSTAWNCWRSFRTLSMRPLPKK